MWSSSGPVCQGVSPRVTGSPPGMSRWSWGLAGGAGGRILTEDVEGGPHALGAQWIGDTHHRMEALASELGVGIYPQFEDGETSYEFAGEVLRERAFYARYAGEL